MYLYSFLSSSTSGKNTSILLSNKEKEKKREASAFVCTSSSGWNGGNREKEAVQSSCDIVENEVRLGRVWNVY